MKIILRVLQVVSIICIPLSAAWIIIIDLISAIVKNSAFSWWGVLSLVVSACVAILATAALNAIKYISEDKDSMEFEKIHGSDFIPELTEERKKQIQYIYEKATH